MGLPGGCRVKVLIKFDFLGPVIAFLYEKIFFWHRLCICRKSNIEISGMKKPLASH